MTIATSIFTFTFLPLFLLLSSTFTPVTANNLISETCKKAAQNDPNLSYKFCLTSLQAAPNSPGADLRQLGLISMKLVQHNVTNTSRYIKHLLKNKQLDKFVRASLYDCLDLYTDAKPTIKQSHQGLQDEAQRRRQYPGKFDRRCLHDLRRWIRGETVGFPINEEEQ
ncbi:hypothetical protein ACLB2K_072514 [Fragaria x ananassa]